MTEVRGPFSDVMGKRRLWVRHLPASEVSSMTRSSAVELVEISHTRFVYVCESGLLQHALAQVWDIQVHVTRAQKCSRPGAD